MTVPIWAPGMKRNTTVKKYNNNEHIIMQFKTNEEEIFYFTDARVEVKLNNLICYSQLSFFQYQYLLSLRRCDDKSHLR